MLKTKIRSESVPFSDLLQVRSHHLRSVQIERDYQDPSAALHYVVTPFLRATTTRLAQGFAPRSTQRAWRLTGDYGSGKSTFALALARVAAGRMEGLPTALHDLRPAAPLEPVLVVGEREPVGASVLRALAATAQRCLKKVPAKLADLLDPAAGTAPKRVIEAIQGVQEYIAKAGEASGLLIILDELGKNLEFAADHAEADDVYLLQHLAELAARSGDRPIMVVAIVHQAVATYAAGLSSGERREWEKVAGRFEEVVFAPPLEQTATLIAAALDVDCRALPRGLSHSAVRTMDRALGLGWYGVSAARDSLKDLAPQLLPLDATVLPVFTRIMRRFGQNERSLFSFLSSTEPFGLMAHAAQARDAMPPYRLHNLYDYLAANFANLIAGGPHATRWGLVDDILRSVTLQGHEEAAVLKTVALLNLLDEPSLAATPQAIDVAVAGDDPEASHHVVGAITRLTREVHVLYNRGAGGALCLWPHTSVDLDEAFARACEALKTSGEGIDDIRRMARTDPMVARRHYVQTGALRHFDISYIDASDVVAIPTTRVEAGAQAADGRIFVVMSETERDRTATLDVLAGQPQLSATTLVAVPRPLGALKPLMRDVAAWQWLRGHTPALAGDRIARVEAGRQLALAEGRLAKALGALLDLTGTAAADMVWFGHSGRLDIRSGRALRSYLSDLCDLAFAKAPKVHNELINRRALSTAAARARHQLIEALANHSDQPGLGISDAGTPPERAMYLSILEAGHVHVQHDGAWIVRIPSSRDPLNLGPSLRAIGEMLRVQDKPVGYEDVASLLRGPGFGIRDGLIPLLVAIYLRAQWHETAVYEDGTYLDQVGGPEFTRIVKEPEAFHFQHCAITGVRAEIFSRLAVIVGAAEQAGEPALLDVVRPLVTFVAKLPDHARRTSQLSAGTAAAREALLAGLDPAKLLFSDLPRAFGLPAIDNDAVLDDVLATRFVTALSTTIRELQHAYSKLIDRITSSLAGALGGQEDLETLQPALQTRAQRVVKTLAEPELKVFVQRLADAGLHPREWLQSVASLVAGKPPERWTDSDEADFHHRLPLLARRFQHVEAMHFPGRNEQATAYRMSVTCADGREIERIYRLEPGQEAAVAEVEEALRAILVTSGEIGRIAAARLLLRADGDLQMGTAQHLAAEGE